MWINLDGSGLSPVEKEGMDVESEIDGGREISVDKITLKCGTIREVETVPWDQLPTRRLEFEGFNETFPCAESVAFLDTNTLTEKGIARFLLCALKART